MSSYQPRYEGPTPTGSQVRDLANLLLVVGAAPYAGATEQDLYFIEAADERLHEKPIKIGVSGHVPSRLNALQTACPYRLEVKRVERRMGLVERQLHNWLREYRTFGEWFEPAPLVSSIATDGVPIDYLLTRPALDGMVAWANVTRDRLDDAVERWWDSAGVNSMWYQSQRLLRNRLARNLTVADCYREAAAEDADWGAAA